MLERSPVPPVPVVAPRWQRAARDPVTGDWARWRGYGDGAEREGDGAEREGDGAEREGDGAEREGDGAERHGGSRCA